MTVLVSPPAILDSAEVGADEALSILQDALTGADDGELFLERSESESLVFDDGRLKSAAYDATEGFGLRVVAGETAGYAHANEISGPALRRAADSAALARAGYAGIAADAPQATNRKLYDEVDPLASPPSPTRSPCWPRSTPGPAPAIRAWCRSRPRWSASIARSRSCAATAD